MLRLMADSLGCFGPHLNRGLVVTWHTLLLWVNPESTPWLSLVLLCSKCPTWAPVDGSHSVCLTRKPNPNPSRRAKPGLFQGRGVWRGAMVPVQQIEMRLRMSLLRDYSVSNAVHSCIHSLFRSFKAIHFHIIHSFIEVFGDWSIK